MKNKGLIIVLFAAVACAIAVCVIEFTQGDDVAMADVSENPKTSARSVAVEKPQRKAKRTPRTRKASDRAPGRTAVKISERSAEKPSMALEADEEAGLNEVMKSLFREIQLALDNNDRKKTVALVQKLQAMDEWPDGIPGSVKLKALEALSWFGSSGLSEAVGFLGDSDPEIVETATEKFSEMLCDGSMGDRAVSEVLKEIVKVVHDHDALDMFLSEMNNMRNSVRADTALAVFDSGNADAVAVLQENIDFLFCDNEADYEVKTRTDVENYAKDNPDGEDDEDFYGPTSVD